MLDRLLWLYFFITPWFYVGSRESNLRLTFVDLMLPVGLALLLWARPGCTPWWLKAGVMLGPLAIVTTVQNLAEPDYLSYLLKAIRLAGVFIPALLICRLRLDTASVRRLAAAFAWGGFVSVGVGIAGFLLDWEWTRAIQTFDYGTGQLTPRAGGVFRDSGAYGHMVATWMAFFFAIAWPRIRRWRWSAAAIVLGTGGVAIYVSMSRAAVLDVLVMAAVQSFVLLMRGGRVRYLVASAAIGLAIFGFFQMGTELDAGSSWESRSARVVFGRFATIAQGLTSDVDRLNTFSGNRLRSWLACYDLWLENPMGGVGYKSSKIQYGVIPDNVYMMALVEMGIGGFILVLLVFFGFWSWALRRAAQGGTVALMISVAWAGQLAHGLTADTLTFPASMSLAIAFAAMAWRIEAAGPRRWKLYSSAAAS
jgi:hypothetical protein